MNQILVKLFYHMFFMLVLSPFSSFSQIKLNGFGDPILTESECKDSKKCYRIIKKAKRVLKKGDDEKYIQMLESVKKYDCQFFHCMASHGIAKFYFFEKKYNEAIEEFDYAIKTGHAFPLSYLFNALSYYKNGNVKGCSRMFKKGAWQVKEDSECWYDLHVVSMCIIHKAPEFIEEYLQKAVEHGLRSYDISSFKEVYEYDFARNFLKEHGVEAR